VRSALFVQFPAAARHLDFRIEIRLDQRNALLEIIQQRQVILVNVL
jgi:hypothetical protein